MHEASYARRYFVTKQLCAVQCIKWPACCTTAVNNRKYVW